MTLSPSNPDRTRRAERVLAHYACIEGATDELKCRSMTATLVSDLLADLMPYASFWSISLIASMLPGWISRPRRPKKAAIRRKMGFAPQGALSADDSGA